MQTFKKLPTIVPKIKTKIPVIFCYFLLLQNIEPSIYMKTYEEMKIHENIEISISKYIKLFEHLFEYTILFYPAAIM